MLNIRRLIPTESTFYLLLFTSLLLVIRIYLNSNELGWDEAEQIVYAHQLASGYPAQPPLYSWLQYFLFEAFGVNLFSLALLRYALIFGCLYFYHQICRIHCKDTLLAWCATLSWALIPHISLDLLKSKTHLILALLMVCSTWYWFIKPSHLSKWAWSAVLGLLIGLGLLSKFNYLVFLALVFITACAQKEYRSYVFGFHIFLSLLIAILVSSPYWLWLINHSELGFLSAYKLAPPDQGQWNGIMKFILGFLPYIGPVILLPAFLPISKPTTVPSKQNQLLWRYHLLLFPFLLIFILAVGIHDIKSRWLLPLFFLFPVALCSLVDKQNYQIKKAKIYIALCLTVQIIILFVWAFRTPSLANFPLQNLVNEIKHERQPIDLVVSDSQWLLGSIMLKMPEYQTLLVHPRVTSKLPQGNLLILWEGNHHPLWVRNLAPNVTDNKILMIPGNNDETAISRAWLPKS